MPYHILLVNTSHAIRSPCQTSSHLFGSSTSTAASGIRYPPSRLWRSVLDSFIVFVPPVLPQRFNAHVHDAMPIEHSIAVLHELRPRHQVYLVHRGDSLGPLLERLVDRLKGGPSKVKSAGWKLSRARLRYTVCSPGIAIMVYVRDCKSC
ncbi:hypothetical protein BV25DRAFT_497840 [Artomyces pyxidatus]|uniref:Uncharacterized protein n=1 Tax=Artomyces pyxidatus TaxID=48021 RepID=A0ACB8SDQ6_9AGAM|nr:hypothetical protein BV25DRAFT_497840 [Artomyces pyxidatus]